jgi:hypothetical protein
MRKAEYAKRKYSVVELFFMLSIKDKIICFGKYIARIITGKVQSW